MKATILNIVAGLAASKVQPNWWIVEGREDLSRFYEQIRHLTRDGTQHFNTAYVITKIAHGAVATGYMLTVARDGKDQPWHISGSGVYDDVLVKIPGECKFQKRNFTVDTFVGYPIPFPTAQIG